MWPELVGRLFLCSVPRGPSFVARLEPLAAEGKGTGFYFLVFPQACSFILVSDCQAGCRPLTVIHWVMFHS